MKRNLMKDIFSTDTVGTYGNLNFTKADLNTYSTTAAVCFDIQSFEDF